MSVVLATRLCLEHKRSCSLPSANGSSAGFCDAAVSAGDTGGQYTLRMASGDTAQARKVTAVARSASGPSGRAACQAPCSRARPLSRKPAL